MDLGFIAFLLEMHISVIFGPPSNPQPEIDSPRFLSFSTAVYKRKKKNLEKYIWEERNTGEATRGAGSAPNVLDSFCN